MADGEMLNDAKHLVLVGLMGAGKTTVGQRCAARLDRPFVDTDRLVEAGTGMTVAEIFEQRGEAAFRALERDAVADACASPTPLVIACGGGAVLDAENRQRLHDTSVVVWLQASPAELGARVGATADRPLLRGGARVATTLERLTELRAPAYESAADLAVDTDALTVDDVAARVIEEWRAWNG
jgi:shikimate kinase